MFSTARAKGHLEFPEFRVESYSSGIWGLGDLTVWKGFRSYGLGRNVSVDGSLDGVGGFGVLFFWTCRSDWNQSSPTTQSMPWPQMHKLLQTSINITQHRLSARWTIKLRTYRIPKLM